MPVKIFPGKENVSEKNHKAKFITGGFRSKRKGTNVVESQPKTYNNN